MFRSAGHEARAGLIQSLFSLPLPTPRWRVDGSERLGLDPSNYDAILSSLKDIVEKAVQAVRSIDPSSFSEGWVIE
jgi:hypothetical protein